MDWTNKPEDKRNKEIMKLVDKKKYTFVQIAGLYKISNARAAQIYHREKEKTKKED